MARREFEEQPDMKLKSRSFQENELIPKNQAFCVPDTSHRIVQGDNISPDLSWEDVPYRANSLVLICRDLDWPVDTSLFNRADRPIPRNAERTDFYHWVLVDLSTEEGPIRAGEFSREVTEGGKDGPEGPRDTRQGLNDFTNLYQGDPDMQGRYFGYDGPCPPWNDARLHRYQFSLYAIRPERCPVDDVFTAADVLDAIDGLILAEAHLTAVYTLNPDVRANIIREHHGAVRGGSNPARPR